MVYPTLRTGAKLRAVLLKNSYSLWLVKYSSIAQRDENVFILHIPNIAWNTKFERSRETQRRDVIQFEYKQRRIVSEFSSFPGRDKKNPIATYTSKFNHKISRYIANFHIFRVTAQFYETFSPARPLHSAATGQQICLFRKFLAKIKRHDKSTFSNIIPLPLPLSVNFYFNANICPRFPRVTTARVNYEN